MKNNIPNFWEQEYSRRIWSGTGIPAHPWCIARSAIESLQLIWEILLPTFWLWMRCIFIKFANAGVWKDGTYWQSKCLIVMVCVGLVCVLVCKMLGDLSKETEVQGGIFALADLYFVFFIYFYTYRVSSNFYLFWFCSFSAEWIVCFWGCFVITFSTSRVNINFAVIEWKVLRKTLKGGKLFGRNLRDGSGFKFGLSAAPSSTISKIKFSLLNQKF